LPNAAEQRDELARKLILMKPQRHNAWKKSSSPDATHAPAFVLEERQGNTPNSCAHERIPLQWAWHYRTLLQLRDRLVHAHAEHSTQAVTPTDMLGGDVAEIAQEQTDRDVLWAELGNEADQLFEVDCALQRIRDGTYGFCEKTGHPISSARLRAVPWTRYSLSAAQPFDQRPADAKKRRR
jgi:RNA polymerase-binding transcription factor DksA